MCAPAKFISGSRRQNFGQCYCRQREISGEVKGNMKIKESLQLTATAKVLGDVEAKILVVEAGALLYGKVAMPGIDQSEVKAARAAKTLVGKKNDEMSAGA